MAMTDLPIIDTAIQGWRDALAALERMPNLFWIALGALIALGILQLLIGPYLIVRLILALAQAAALTPLAIAMHRFVLLNEARDGYDFSPNDPRFQKFFMFTIGLEILGALPSIIALLFAFVSLFLSSLVLLALAVAVAIVSVRCAMVFPAIAVDAAGADWRNAMEDARGHSWRIFLVLLCTALPAVIIEIILLAVLGWSLLLSAIALGLVVPLVTVALVAAVAASLSRLFAAYAAQLGKPTNIYLRPAV